MLNRRSILQLFSAIPFTNVAPKADASLMASLSGADFDAAANEAITTFNPPLTDTQREARKANAIAQRLRQEIVQRDRDASFPCRYEFETRVNGMQSWSTAFKEHILRESRIEYSRKMRALGNMSFAEISELCLNHGISPIEILKLWAQDNYGPGADVSEVDF